MRIEGLQAEVAKNNKMRHCTFERVEGFGLSDFSILMLIAAAISRSFLIQGKDPIILERKLQ